LPAQSSAEKAEAGLNGTEMREMAQKLLRKKFFLIKRSSQSENKNLETRSVFGQDMCTLIRQM